MSQLCARRVCVEGPETDEEMGTRERLNVSWTSATSRCERRSLSAVVDYCVRELERAKDLLDPRTEIAKLIVSCSRERTDIEAVEPEQSAGERREPAPREREREREPLAPRGFRSRLERSSRCWILSLSLDPPLSPMRSNPF